MKHKLLLISSVILFGGCADGALQLPQLPPAPSLTAQQNVHVATAAGQSRAVTVVVPPATCNNAAYVAGFRDGYIYQWNVDLNSKAAAAPAAEQGKLASARLVAPPEPLPASSMTIQQSMCAAQSRTAGQTAAYVQAHNDFLATAASL